MYTSKSKENEKESALAIKHVYGARKRFFPICWHTLKVEVKNETINWEKISVCASVHRQTFRNFVCDVLTSHLWHANRMKFDCSRNTNSINSIIERSIQTFRVSTIIFFSQIYHTILLVCRKHLFISFKSMRCLFVFFSLYFTLNAPLFFSTAKNAYTIENLDGKKY